MKIVDEFTGRILEGRRWSDGLHQAVEAKERVRIHEENHTWATVTLQNYFRMYEKLAGMTGTAETEAAEFASTYELQVVPIPTHQPMVRVDEPDLIFKTEEGKFEAVVEDLDGALRDGPAGPRRHGLGREVRAALAAARQAGHPAHRAEREAPHPRGGDRRPGGAPARDHRRHEHGRTRRRHPARRQSRGTRSRRGRAPRASTPTPTRAGSASQSLLPKFKAQCAAEADEVRALGGLYVLGSERHESRRIDNQLRGRSGRQGDPGESRFYLSLEDELMRLFATGAMSWVMDRALPDDVPIEARMVTRAIERAQNTVEQKNAEVAQGRPQVRRGDERAAQGDLRAPHAGHRRRGPQGLYRGAPDRDGRTGRRGQLPERLRRGVGPRASRRRADAVLPDQVHASTISSTRSSIEQLTESILAEALEFYDERETTFPGGAEMARDLERSIMLQIIDQRWRQHLVEMDYLREGIHLRGIAQTDPLVAWQREGFEMFGKLMDSIDDDYVRYVMHVQVLAEPAEEPDYAQATFVAADEPVSDLGELAQGVVALPGGEVDPSPGAAQQGALAPNRANGAPAQAAAPEATASRGGQQGSGSASPEDDRRSDPADWRQASRRSADQGRPQRAVLVRKRSQVQGLPRRELNGHGSNPRRRPGRRAP